MLIKLLIYVCQFNFGQFEIEEFKKFLRLGIIFALIIGIYWTLRPLKDSIFIQLVDKMHLPYAKTISVLALLPLVMFYTRLLEKTSSEKMLFLLPIFYGTLILFFSVAIYIAQTTTVQISAPNITAKAWLGTHILGYSWYLFVESFGSLVVALFWAFTTDITTPDSAKRGFPLVVAMGQIGGVICPYGIGGLPHRFDLNSDALSLGILGVLCFSIIRLVHHFLRVTPRSQLLAFNGIPEPKLTQKLTSKQALHNIGLKVQQTPHEQFTREPGFLEGLKILLKHRYLLAMFFANFIYEFIVTVFDFNFKIAAGTNYSGVALSNYLSIYGSSVNIVSLLCLLLGISNVTRFLGIGVALAAMPIVVATALYGFLTVDSLTFLFALMVGSKAINYALNGPALKQLYIPTTKDVRFKAQAWIETFGSRASKEAGSIFNMLLKPLQSFFGATAGKSYYLLLSGAVGFPLLSVWLIIALYLTRTFKKALKEESVVC